MKKSFKTKEGNFLHIRPDIVSREVNRSDWWSTATRFFFEDETDWTDLSYPNGYNDFNTRKEINYNYESLLRLAQLF